MNHTISELLKDSSIEPEEALVKISDALFLDLPIAQIKEKATNEAFTIFIGVQIIGCYKSGGWATGIFSNFPEIVPYIATTLQTLEVNDVAKEVETIIREFPAQTDFTKNDHAYCDVINFLHGHERFIKDPQKFAHYSDADKETTRQNYHNSIDIIEKSTAPIWGYDAPDHEGWGKLSRYAQSVSHAKLWK